MMHGAYTTFLSVKQSSDVVQKLAYFEQLITIARFPRQFLYQVIQFYLLLTIIISDTPSVKLLHKVHLTYIHNELRKGAGHFTCCRA